MKLIFVLTFAAFVAVATAAPTSTDDIVDEQVVMTQVISDDAVAPEDTLTQVRAGGWIRCDKDFRIKIRNGNCLDASERNKNGGKVHLWTCDASNKNQRWRYQHSWRGRTLQERRGRQSCSGKGFNDALIRSTHTGGNGKCLDASQRNTDGGKVHMWACDEDNINQFWTYKKYSADGPSILQQSSSFRFDMVDNTRWHMCLDATGSHNSPGGKVHMWKCDYHNANQKWEIGYQKWETMPPQPRAGARWL